ncbi:aurora kinase B-like [Oppia nitens]|uniref:aurora kinase B-like n=1 Tax=Oppia nitens TaxID=1686743 RepID=UPI0023DC8EBD|nr:aurora kinase B-like [Oppia nitens]
MDNHKHNVNDIPLKVLYCTVEPKVDQFMDQISYDNIVGSGTYGDVYKVKCRQTDRSYALKVVPHLDDTDSSVWDNEIEYIRNARSKYVANYYDHRIIGDQLFLLMEYCSGNLHQLLDSKPEICRRRESDPIGKYEFYLSAILFKQILEAVQHIHVLEPQIIHRNIRPENLMIAFNGNSIGVKLIGFGIATHHYRNGHNLKHTTGVCGCILYCAPEVASGFDYDHRVDVYSLSIVGAKLFGIDLDVLKAKDATQLTPEVCCKEPMKQVFQWLCRMNSAEPNDRPDCTEVLADYNNWNIPEFDIITTWMANNYDHIYEQLVPPFVADQPKWENLLVRAGLDQYASLGQVIDMLATEKWSKLLNPLFTDNK